MKTYLKLLPFLFLGIFSAAVSGCTEENKESCDAKEQDVGTCSAEDITICCDDAGSCYYTYQGDKYSLDELASQCSAGKTVEEIRLINLQIDGITSRLIEEAKLAAICQ
jgi:hypothetical protein